MSIFRGGTVGWACAVLIGSGCSGTGWINTVPLRFSKLSPTETLEIRSVADRCFHWVDDHGRLCVAMSDGGEPPPTGTAQRAMATSLVFGSPPVGGGGTYRVNRDTLRMIARDGSSHSRWASLSGIVTVWTDKRNRVHGRFRLIAKHQSFHIWLGWHGNGRHVLYGEFTATENPASGQRIVSRTESGGMERKDSTTGNGEEPSLPLDDD